MASAWLERPSLFGRVVNSLQQFFLYTYNVTTKTVCIAWVVLGCCAVSMKTLKHRGSIAAIFSFWRQHDDAPHTMAERDPIIDALSRAEALERTTRGGTVLCLEVPAGVEFGMDMRSYTAGPNFGGMKMIPTGDNDSMGAIHLMTWGSDLTRCGAFIALHPSDVLIFKWSAHDEMLCPLATGQEAEQQAGAVRRMEHDARLGPYPLATEDQWRGLSSHVSAHVLRRAGIPPGTIVEAGSMDSAELEREPVARPQ